MGSDDLPEPSELVGRADAIRQVEAFVTQSGHPPVFCLRGEIGMGKSELVRVATEKAESRGLSVALTTCHATIGPDNAFGPVIDLLLQLAPSRRLRRWQRSREFVGTAVPDLLALAPIIGPALSLAAKGAQIAMGSGSGQQPGLIHYQSGVARAMSEVLVQHCKNEQGTLLVVDDAHNIDPSSLLTLDHLVRTASPRTVTVMLALRSVDRVVAPYLTDQLQMWLIAGLAKELVLGPLTPADAATLVAAVAGPQTADLASGLFELSGGNPLLLVEAAKWTAQQRANDAADAQPLVPPPVQHIARYRIAHLGDVAQDVLRIGALSGDPIHADVVQGALSLRPTELRSTLRSLLTVGLLERAPNAVDGSEMYRFRHGFVREVVISDTSPEEQQHLHGLAARALEQLGSGEPENLELSLQLRLALHRSSSSDFRGAADLRLKIARRLVRAEVSLQEAQHLAKVALMDSRRSSAGDAMAARVRAEAIELLLNLTQLQWAGRLDVLRDESVAQLADEAAAAAAATGDALLSARMLLLKSKVILHTEGLESSLAAIQEAIVIAESAGDLRLRFITTSEYGRHASKRGVGAGLEFLTRAATLHEELVALGDPRDPVIDYAWNLTELQLAVGNFDAGNFDRAVDLLSAAIQRLERQAPSLELPLALNYYGQVLIALGQFDSAVAVLEHAIEATELVNAPTGWREYCQALTAKAQLGRWPDEECRALAAEAWHGMEKLWLVTLVPIVRNLYAEVLLATSRGSEDLEVADCLAADSIAETERSGMRRSEVAALCLRSRVHLTRGEPATAAEFGREAIEILVESGDMSALCTEEVLYYGGDALSAAGAKEEADRAFRWARAKLERKASNLADSKVRVTYLALPLNVRILATCDDR